MRVCASWACIYVGGPCAGGQPHVYISCNEIRAHTTGLH